MQYPQDERGLNWTDYQHLSDHLAAAAMSYREDAHTWLAADPVLARHLRLAAERAMKASALAHQAMLALFPSELQEDDG